MDRWYFLKLAHYSAIVHVPANNRDSVITRINSLHESLAYADLHYLAKAIRSITFIVDEGWDGNAAQQAHAKLIEAATWLMDSQSKGGQS